ncbi:hypothetical protein V8E53_005927 [Lactarius tabidus]
MESDFPVDTPADLDEDSETSYVSGDTLGKLWAFINQVRLSPQASAFFVKCCAEEGLPHLELIKYVRMCWSSMYDLLKRAFLLKAHPALAQQVFSSEHIPTVSHVFPTIEFLLTSLEAAEKNIMFAPIRNAITAGISNLTKWYRRLDVCHVYAVSTVIDPSIKLVYIKKNWGPDFVLCTRTILTTIILNK